MVSWRLGELADGLTRKICWTLGEAALNLALRKFVKTHRFCLLVLSSFDELAPIPTSRPGSSGGNPHWSINKA